MQQCKADGKRDDECEPTNTHDRHCALLNEMQKLKEIVDEKNASGVRKCCMAHKIA